MAADEIAMAEKIWLRRIDHPSCWTPAVLRSTGKDETSDCVTKQTYRSGPPHTKNSRKATRWGRTNACDHEATVLDIAQPLQRKKGSSKAASYINGKMHLSFKRKWESYPQNASAQNMCFRTSGWILLDTCTCEENIVQRNRTYSSRLV
ncbi:hypothetical protein TTRE_0000652001 [Trichuris trichiura]|uniref:Uncharacterized protein n=1 Tax=Trichuris trichiura TaxID=36087 RepID=A0A077ZFC5_TRITR|nr:hypothetical protein TTRE_0000652001 [Trichuris trichiura]